MYRADSDILTIVLTLITFAAGIYSSVKRKKDKEAGIEGPEYDAVEMDLGELDEESPFFFLKDSVNPEHSVNPEQGAEAAVMAVEEEETGIFPEGIAVTHQEPVPAEPAESSEIETDDKEKDNGRGMTKPEKKFKISPKDMVLYAEIMNPKHKEF